MKRRARIALRTARLLTAALPVLAMVCLAQACEEARR